MIHKILPVPQEEAVLRLPGVPGGVQIIIQVADFGDIPCVIPAAADTDDHTVAHAQLQKQAVHQHRIALTNRFFVYQRRVSSVFEPVIVVIQIIVIIGHIVAQVVIHRFDLLVITLAADIQGLQQLRHSSVNFCFLLRRSVVSNLKRNGMFIAPRIK